MSTPALISSILARRSWLTLPAPLTNKKGAATSAAAARRASRSTRSGFTASMSRVAVARAGMGSGMVAGGQFFAMADSAKRAGKTDVCVHWPEPQLPPPHWLPAHTNARRAVMLDAGQRCSTQGWKVHALCHARSLSRALSLSGDVLVQADSAIRASAGQPGLRGVESAGQHAKVVPNVVATQHLDGHDERVAGEVTAARYMAW